MSKTQAVETGPGTGKLLVVDVLAEGDFFLILVLTHVTLHWLAHERTP